MPIVSGKSREHGLIAGVLIVVSVFFVAAFGTTRLLLLAGWNPLEGRASFYGGVASALILGALAAYGLFRWARKS